MMIVMTISLLMMMMILALMSRPAPFSLREEDDSSSIPSLTSK